MTLLKKIQMEKNYI